MSVPALDLKSCMLYVACISSFIPLNLFIRRQVLWITLFTWILLCLFKFQAAIYHKFYTGSDLMIITVWFLFFCLLHVQPLQRSCICTALGREKLSSGAFLDTFSLVQHSMNPPTRELSFMIFPTSISLVLKYLSN